MFLYPRLNYKISFLQVLKLSFRYFFDINKEVSLDNFNSDRTFYFNHARSGLSAILSLFPENTIVGVQPLTCVTVLEAIEASSCKIHFLDINNNYVIDTDTIEKEINKFDILLLTHTYGNPVSVDTIKEKYNNKVIIEDCAHALGTKINEEDYAGTIGDFSYYSFGMAKFPSWMTGGCVVVNNDDYLAIFKQSYSKFRRNSFWSILLTFFKSMIYSIANCPMFYFLLSGLKAKRDIHKCDEDSTSYSENFQLDNYNTYIIRSLIRNKNKIIYTQKENAKQLIKSLKSNESFSLPDYDDRFNFFLLSVSTRDPEHFIKYAKQRGIEIGRHFFRSKYLINKFGYIQNSCPNYERLIENMVSIPCHYNYPESKIIKLTQIISRYTNE